MALSPCVAEAFTADELVHTGPCNFHGVSGKATTAAVTITIRDGVDASGTVVAVHEVASGASLAPHFLERGLRLKTGLFVDVTTAGGTFEGAVYHS